MTHCHRCGKDNPAEIHTCTPLALKLADVLEPCCLTIGDAQQAVAAAELRRLHQQELALKEWLDKTEWVQETAKPQELGMHLADVLKQRIDRLVDTLAETHTTYQAKLLHDEALLRQILDDACAVKLCEFNSMSSRSEMIRLLDKMIAALRERLGETE